MALGGVNRLWGDIFDSPALVFQSAASVRPNQRGQWAGGLLVTCPHVVDVLQGYKGAEISLPPTI
jgi:hypothetical protein